MSKVLIQTKDSFEGQKIKLILEEMYLKTLVSFGRQSTFNGILHENPSLFILDSNTITNMTSEYIQEIYSRGFDKPTIILVEKSTLQIKELVKLDKVHVLEKQLIQSMLSGLCMKLIDNPHMKPQTTRRYSTFQPLKIESLSGGSGVNSFMTNLSLGGAYCICEGEALVTKGELVRLKVSLGEVDRQHNMHAKVVWKKTDQETGQTGLGLQFISEQDMYRQLIDKL